MVCSNRGPQIFVSGVEAIARPYVLHVRLLVVCRRGAGEIPHHASARPAGLHAARCRAPRPGCGARFSGSGSCGHGWCWFCVFCVWLHVGRRPSDVRAEGGAAQTRPASFGLMLKARENQGAALGGAGESFPSAGTTESIPIRPSHSYNVEKQEQVTSHWPMTCQGKVLNHGPVSDTTHGQLSVSNSARCKPRKSQSP
jgi:hypothetical protein